MTDTAVVPAAEVPAAPDEPADPLAHLADLEPCGVCGAHWFDGPEGHTHVFTHCWRCGYRPGQVVAPSAYMTAGTGLPQQTVEKIVAELRKGVVEDILAALSSGTAPQDVKVRLEQPGGEG